MDLEVTQFTHLSALFCFISRSARDVLNGQHEQNKSTFPRQPTCINMPLYIFLIETLYRRNSKSDKEHDGTEALSMLNNVIKSD